MKTKKQKNKEKDHLAKLKIEHRKTFFNNLRTFCNYVADSDIFDSFDQKFLAYIYEHRFYNIKFVPKVEGTISNTELETLYTFWNERCKVCMFHLDGKTEGLPTNIVFVEGITLAFHIRKYEENKYQNLEQIKSVFIDKYNEENESLVLKIFHKLEGEIQLIGLLHSSLRDGLVYGERKIDVNKKTIRLELSVLVSQDKPIIKHFVVDGHARPAIKIGAPFHEEVYRYIQILHSDIGLASKEDKEKNKLMDVYVQSHALNRLDERLGLAICFMHYFLYSSFIDVGYHWDKNGRLMIDYRYFDTKVGYLVCSVQNDTVLVHSFLFLTFNGTPEGNKLGELTGLNKIDKKYLAIDTFNSLLAYKIEENEFVKDLFIKAGCAEIFKLKEKDSVVDFLKNTKANPEIIARYLTQKADLPKIEII
jgi:hypothetical protein